MYAPLEALTIAVLLATTVGFAPSCASEGPAESGAESSPEVSGEPPAAMTSDTPDVDAQCVDGVCGSAPPAYDAWNLCATLSRRAGVPFTHSETISWAEHLCELADLDRFTSGPANHVLKMASSRDPASSQEGGPGWFANDDFSHYLRKQGDEFVMMESTGPGVITRFWSATPIGILRIYIDDPDKPAVEVDMARLFSGRLGEPWTAPFVFQSAGGSNFVFPLPYSRYARITTTTSIAKFFYQVNYREYDPGVAVESFSAATARALIPLSRQVRNWLLNPSDLRGFPALGETVLSFNDARRTQRANIGPAVVRELVVRGFEPTESWLRKTRLIMRVDGVETIDTPVGSLFTADLGAASHASLAASVRPDALTLRWPMPVHGNIEVELQSNGGRIGPAVTMRLRHSRGVPDDARQFHAKWSGPRVFNITDPLDWKLIDVEGDGWYVGTVLNIANPVLQWWGEGDEKIFIDGEQAPSLFGTGTEDYFGFGWCSNQVFALPWTGQTRVAGALNRGRASMYRWHVLDAIPFHQQFRFNLEVLHWRTGFSPVPFTQDALAMWYAKPGGKVLSRGVDLSDFQLPLVDSTPAAWPFERYDCRYASLF